MDGAGSILAISASWITIRGTGLTDRDSIAAWLRREGHPELALRVECYADRGRQAPIIPAEVWMRKSSVGH